MKILGIGTDIVNINRINKALKLNGTKFKNKIFSKIEFFLKMKLVTVKKKRNPHNFLLKDLLQRRL